MADKPPPATESYVRALRLLETLAGIEQPAGLARLVEASGLSKITTYRILRALQEEGFIDHVGRSGYRIGARAVSLASQLGPRPVVQYRARPVLQRLANLIGETATLHLRSGYHRTLVLAAAPQTTSEGRRRVRVGERSPLASGCSGLVILANLRDAEIDAILRAQLTPSAHPAVREDLAGVRQEGYALSFSANHPGLNGIAAPLLDPDSGWALGSIALAGHESRLSEAKLREFASPLVAGSTELSPAIAAVLGPNSSVRLESLELPVRSIENVEP